MRLTETSPRVSPTRRWSWNRVAADGLKPSSVTRQRKNNAESAPYLRQCISALRHKNEAECRDGGTLPKFGREAKARGRPLRRNLPTGAWSGQSWIPPNEPFRPL